MGKNYRNKHRAVTGDDDQPIYKQPGCVWGLVHALNYHHWQPSIKKIIINHEQQHGLTHPKPGDEVEIEKLLDEKENLFVNSKRPRSCKKKSLRARIKALIVKEELPLKPDLRRTYSIHHLEDSNDGFGKIRRNSKKQIIFFPDNRAETAAKRKSDLYAPYNKESNKLHSETEHDVLEIFKVDKDLLIKHLRDDDETLANFSRSELGLGFLNPSSKLSKSRSFPMRQLSQRRRLKPVKLENKKTEVWSFPKEEDKFKAVNHEDLDELRNNTIKRIHQRSSSLNESLDKYTKLYQKSFANDGKLHHSKSLRVATSESEHHVPAYFRRLRSMSSVDSYYSFVNFEILPNKSSTVTAKEKSSGSEHINEEGDEDIIVVSLRSGEDSHTNAKEPVDTTESVRTIQEDEDAEKVKEIDVESDESILNKLGFEHEEINTSDEVLQHTDSSALDSEISVQEMESQCIDLQITRGLEHTSNDSNHTNSTHAEIHQGQDKISNMFATKNNSDLNYAKLLLDSGIASDALERTWHAYDQPLSPRVFEEVESNYPIEDKSSTNFEDLSTFWHHQMLFNLVNEKLVEIYDISLPYYPKALSSNCRVRTFPKGNHIIEEVLKSVGSLLDLSLDKSQSLDRIVAQDFTSDQSWMNLQVESEMKGLEIEDIIFEELVEEVIDFLR